MMVKLVGEAPRGLERRSLSIFLGEQDFDLALTGVDRVYIMNEGRIVHECASAELAGDEETRLRFPGVERRTSWRKRL